MGSIALGADELGIHTVFRPRKTMDPPYQVGEVLQVIEPWHYGYVHGQSPYHAVRYLDGSVTRHQRLLGDVVTWAPRKARTMPLWASRRRVMVAGISVEGDRWKIELKTI